jgi:hypothetical protein
MQSPVFLSLSTRSCGHLPEDEWDILPDELGFIMAGDPKPTVRGADLAVMAHTDEIAEGMSREPAHLIVEVVSPSNAPDDIERKRTRYLSFGVQEMWIVHPKAKTMHVYLNPAAARLRGHEAMFVCDESGVFNSTLDFVVVARELFR